MATNYKLNLQPDRKTVSQSLLWNPPLSLKVDSTPPSYEIKSLGDLPIYDQGALGSCTANAILFSYHYVAKFKNNKYKHPSSRLYQYRESLLFIGDGNDDTGAYIEDAITVPNTRGVLPEYVWPYINSTVNFKILPKNQTMDSLRKLASASKGIEYNSIEKGPNLIYSLENILYSGFPIVFGFWVYPSFFSTINRNRKAIVTVPKKGENILGGHAVCLVGYNRINKSFKVRNSWGPRWGDSGYFYMSYDFLLTNNVFSFWVIKSVN